MNILPKLIACLFWLCFAFNAIAPFADPAGQIIRWAGIVLALVHVLEFILLKAKLDKLNAGGIHGFSQTLLFGFIYWLPLLRKN